jgi:hypothetical protein
MTSADGIVFCTTRFEVNKNQHNRLGPDWESHVNSGAKLISSAVLAVAALLLASCSSNVSIADITRDPGQYANKDVTVTGRVSNSFGALGAGLFQINDGTGTMWVYSQNGIPAGETKVAVTGRIEQGFSIGGRSFATILRETERRN